jgi:hypothetical protein
VGAFDDRATGAALAEFLAPDFTVFTYARRARVDGGDTPPDAVERKFAVLDALIGATGGSAAVFGFSSGAILALHAATHGSAIGKLALYDAPFDVDAGHARPRVDHASNLAAPIAEGRRGDAVEYCQLEVVGPPAEVVAQVRHAPFRPALERMAHTLVYEATILGGGPLPIGLAASVRVRTVVIDGGDFGHASMRRAVQTLAAALPHGRHLGLEEQQHQIVPATIGPPRRAFFTN